VTGRLIALTGATGFIGRHLLAALSARGDRVRVLLRRPVAVPEGASSAVVGDLARPMNMAAALSGVDAVVHSAGLAHAMSGAPEDDFRNSNTEATRKLAEAAQRAKVGRFVFLSSIRAQSGPSAATPLTDADAPAPTDPYGRSKLAAEEALAEIGLDPDPLTLPEMIAAMRSGLGRGPGLLPCPPSLIDLACRTTGRQEVFDRLSGSLVARADGLAALGWQPVQTTRDGLAGLARAGG
jgi:uncharacterized protein YbjT (DUF2867 family)